MTGLSGESAACPVCGRPYVPVNKDGGIRVHKGDGGERCSGSGRVAMREATPRYVMVGWREVRVPGRDG